MRVNAVRLGEFGKHSGHFLENIAAENRKFLALKLFDKVLVRIIEFMIAQSHGRDIHVIEEIDHDAAFGAIDYGRTLKEVAAVKIHDTGILRSGVGSIAFNKVAQNGESANYAFFAFFSVGVGSGSNGAMRVAGVENYKFSSSGRKGQKNE
jgi:hypothetical protein